MVLAAWLITPQDQRNDDQVDVMTQALLRWQMAPVETTYVCLVPRVQISPI